MQQPFQNFFFFFFFDFAKKKMCGRFCCSLDPSTLKCRLQKENVIQSAQIEWIGEEKHKSSYNVCPTRFVPVLFEKGENKEKLIQSMVISTCLVQLSISLINIIVLGIHTFLVEINTIE